MRQMREEWKGSRDGRVPASIPKRPSLFEHEYGVPIRDSEWQALRDHVVRCLRNFHRLPAADRHQAHADRALGASSRTSAPSPSRARACSRAPDFGYWNAADRLQLVDWKTGGGGEGAGLQLGGYALYALEVLGVDLGRAWTCSRSTSARAR